MFGKEQQSKNLQKIVSALKKRLLQKHAHCNGGGFEIKGQEADLRSPEENQYHLREGGCIQGEGEGDCADDRFSGCHRN